MNEWKLYLQYNKPSYWDFERSPLIYRFFRVFVYCNQYLQVVINWFLFNVSIVFLFCCSCLVCHYGLCSRFLLFGHGEMSVWNGISDDLPKCCVCIPSSIPYWCVRLQGMQWRARKRHRFTHTHNIGKGNSLISSVSIRRYWLTVWACTFSLKQNKQIE